MFTVPAVLALSTRLRKALDRLQSITVDAEMKLAELNTNEFFRRSPRAHKDSVRADIENEYRAARELAARVALHETERAIAPLAAEIRAARAQAMQAPRPVDAFLKRSGGHRSALSTTEEIAIKTFDLMLRNEFQSRYAAAQPSALLRAYEAAEAEGTDEGDSLTRWIEDRYGAGWQGAQPSSDQEVQSAIRLRNTITVAQAMRVPAVLDDLDQAHDAARRLMAKAAGLYSLAPLALDQRPDLRAAAEEALADLDAAAVTSPEPESVA